MNEALGEQSEMTEEQMYFLMHGTYPPEVGLDTSPEELEARIEAHESLASRTTDTEEAERLIHEASYLRDKLQGLRRLGQTAVQQTA